MKKTAEEIAEFVLEKIGLAPKPTFSSYWASKFKPPSRASMPSAFGGFTDTGSKIKPLMQQRRNLLETARRGITQVGSP